MVLPGMYTHMPLMRDCYTACLASDLTITHMLECCGCGWCFAGEKLCEKPFEILFEANWMPAPPGSNFEDRPPSPERLAAASSNGGGGAAGAAGAAGGAAGQSKGAYR
jgi:hypothetical protein